MSWDNYRRRKRSIFDLFDEIFRDMEEEINRLMREFESFSPEEVMGKEEVRRFGPYVYGFRITIGPDGKPIIEEFGNVRKTEGGKRMISEEREPLVDVFERDDEIDVIAELPGVDKEKIKLEITDDRRKLIIRASNSNRKYYKEVDLPAEVDPKSAKATYKNGVLEVKLKKLKPKKEEEKKGYEIRIE